MDSFKIRTVACVVLFFLLSVTATAQETLLSLKNDTIKSGEGISYAATVIANSCGISATPYLVESGARVWMSAIKRIELHPGFRIIKGGYLSVSVFHVESINAPDKEPAAALYPNPVETDLNVTSKYVIRSAKLMDSNGLSILEQREINQASFTLDVSAVRSGLYILEIVSDETIEKVRIQKN